ncbi:MAG: hypothetical protein LBS64_00860, partial [Spirochaetaceae bacterium]|nr:hypothetical protein [Spirochaetaceae bacterium]
RLQQWGQLFLRGSGVGVGNAGHCKNLFYGVYYKNYGTNDRKKQTPWTNFSNSEFNRKVEEI